MGHGRVRIRSTVERTLGRMAGRTDGKMTKLIKSTVTDTSVINDEKSRNDSNKNLPKRETSSAATPNILKCRPAKRSTRG